MNELDEQLKEFYEGRNLPDEKVNAILAMKRTSVKWPLILGLAALLMLCLGIGFFYPRADLTKLVTQEVAYNHQKHAPVDIESDRFEVVQSGLDRLGFSILPSSGSVLRDYELEGGKYCSIQDHLAAQLKVRRKATGETCTLYVVPSDNNLQSIPKTIGAYQGTRVELWHDNGRLFALAREEE